MVYYFHFCFVHCLQQDYKISGIVKFKQVHVDIVEKYAAWKARVKHEP